MTHEFAPTPERQDFLSLKIAYEHRKDELQAMKLRWWDYRLLHPTLSTYLFAEQYAQAHKTWWTRYIEEREAHKARAFEGPDIFQSRDLTSVWLARKSADMLGLPYDFVMEFALQRSLAREFRHLLRPNQMYGEEFEIDITAAWLEQSTRKLTAAQLPFFKVANYRHHPMQDEYRAWLVKQVNARPAPRYRLLARLLGDDAISEPMIAGIWGSVELQDARDYQRMLFSQS